LALLALPCPVRVGSVKDFYTDLKLGRMPLPKDIKLVTFDVYGTLIDWETGIYEAFKKEADKDGFTIEREVLMPIFKHHHIEMQLRAYELYAEVLRRTAQAVAAELEWPLEPVRSNFLPESVPYWKPFPEAVKQLTRIRKKFGTGLISNIDDKMLGWSRRHIPADMDIVVTAQQVRAYKPELAHFKECARRIGGKKGWVHVGSDIYHDVEPCFKSRVPVVWLNREKEEWKSKSRKKPELEVSKLIDLSRELGA